MYLGCKPPECVLMCVCGLSVSAHPFNPALLAAARPLFAPFISQLSFRPARTTPEVIK